MSPLPPSRVTGLKLFVYETVLLGQAIDAVVRLAHTTNSTADGVGLESTGHAPSRLVNFCHVDLKKHNGENLM